MEDPALVPRRVPIFSEFASDPDMTGLVAEFVQNLPAQVDSLMRDWNAQNFSDVARTAHQLKGASAGYGFPTIGLAASTLEADLRGRSAEQIASHFPRIVADLQHLADLCGRARSSRP